MRESLQLIRVNREKCQNCVFVVDSHKKMDLHVTFHLNRVFESAILRNCSVDFKKIIRQKAFFVNIPLIFRKPVTFGCEIQWNYRKL